MVLMCRHPKANRTIPKGHYGHSPWRTSATRLAALLLLVFSSGGPVLAGAQDRKATSQDSSKLSAMLSRLESNDMETREDAFDELRAEIGIDSGNGNTEVILSDFLTKNPSQADRVKVDLIRMLAFENENPTDNYPEVINAVASLNDERAIPALVGAIDTGQIAIQGVVKYGNKALETLFARLNDPDARLRGTAVSTSITILARKDDGASRLRIKNIIDTALKDSDMSVRLSATAQIACLDNRLEFKQLLQQLAQNDPGRINWKDGTTTYPVRYAASDALKDIQNKKPCR
jgi:hypothetical protein